MDAQTLVGCMPGLDLPRAQQLTPGCNEALALASCDTVNRAAMFLAQLGTESISLQYTEEIADGSAYNGRTDLGNTQPGDGPRFKGRSFIQITGRANYGRFSQWAHAKGLVPTADYFLQHPEQLADDRWAWIGAVWYWTVARDMNAYADRDDIVGASWAVNGGDHGLADRIARYAHCKTYGPALLPEDKKPDPVTKPDPQEDDMFGFVVACSGKPLLWKPPGSKAIEITFATLQKLNAKRVERIDLDAGEYDKFAAAYK